MQKMVMRNIPSHHQPQKKYKIQKALVHQKKLKIQIHKKIAKLQNTVQTIEEKAKLIKETQHLQFFCQT